MTTPRSVTDDVVIIGGGFSGLSISALLAAEQLPVTLLESGDLGARASTVNQGWLSSGAWFAPRQPDLARMCHESLIRTIRFCPDCLEPGHTGMLFPLTDSRQAESWTRAWDAAGIPWKPATTDRLHDILPQTADRFAESFQLPDRSMKPQILLRKLADVARAGGVRIHTGVKVTGLNCDDRSVTSVTTSRGEQLRASMVIVATGAGNAELSDYLVCRDRCPQSLYTRVTLQAHLLAVPQFTATPFCVPEHNGLNHLPHHNRDGKQVSVFGVDRWKIVSELESHPPVEAEFDRIRERVRELLPDLDLSEGVGWSGTTVQAMHMDQIEPGAVPLPTVIHHAQEQPCVNNLFSVYPGRATLWSQLAEDMARQVLQRLRPSSSEVARPVWA